MNKWELQLKLKSNEKENNVTFQLTGEKIALLIGKRGQTLNSLQYLTQLVINRYSNQYLMLFWMQKIIENDEMKHLFN